MKISRIRIKNFRSIKYLDINNLQKNKLLVGENNSGKSNILKAIDCVFNPRYVAKENDIYNQRKNGEFTEIDIMLTPIDGKENFDIEWIYVIGKHVVRIDNIDSFSIRCVIKENEMTGRLEIDRFPLMNWDSTNVDSKESSISRIIRQCISSFYITPDRDIIDEVRIRSSNFSRLLKESNLNLSQQDTNDIESKLEEINTLITKKLPDFKKIEEALSNITTTLKHINAVNLLPIPNKLSDLDKGIEILITENDKRLSVDYYGDGTRSWLSILALKSFVELLKKQNELEGLPFFPIMLIEEPESHLHSHAQNKIISQLKDLDSDLIITTHSTNILSNVNDFQVARIFKEGTETKLKTFTKGEVSEEFNNKYNSLIIPYYTEIFFSENVILVEGISDKIFIEKYYEKKFKQKLISNGVSVINTGGSDNIPLFRGFCELFNINNTVFADKDKKEDVLETLKQKNFSLEKTYFTKHKELEFDIVKNNLDIVLAYYKKMKPSTSEKYIEILKSENRLEDTLIKYLCDNKTTYPFMIGEYISNNFIIESINNMFEEI